MGKLLVVAYIIMAFFVGDSRSRCGEERDAYGLVKHNLVENIVYGAIWPVSMVIYWGQHGGLGGFFSRAERADCS